MGSVEVATGWAVATAAEKAELMVEGPAVARAGALAAVARAVAELTAVVTMAVSRAEGGTAA